jgi:two-component system nitrogen regulation response regulator NtrX
LIENITNEIASVQHFAVPDYAEDVLITLQIFDWQGNIKQLRNVIESLIIKAAERENPVVTLDDLPYELRHGDASSLNMASHYMNMPLREAREAFEREYLMTKLSFFKGNISKTAQFIGMERSALHRKLRGLGVSSRYHISDDEYSTE